MAKHPEERKRTYGGQSPLGLIPSSGMKTVRTTEEELEEVARQFEGREDVVAIYVFGSFVTRRKRPEDIDVCVIARRGLDLEKAVPGFISLDSAV